MCALRARLTPRVRLGRSGPIRHEVRIGQTPNAALHALTSPPLPHLDRGASNVVVGVSWRWRARVRCSSWLSHSPGDLRLAVLGEDLTLQRRVREWRVQYGPDREVYFEQVAVPGREAAFDFTDASDLAVTLGGVAFPHLLFEWVLSYSRWTYVGPGAE